MDLLPRLWLSVVLLACEDLRLRYADDAQTRAMGREAFAWLFGPENADDLQAVCDLAGVLVEDVQRVARECDRRYASTARAVEPRQAVRPPWLAA